MFLVVDVNVIISAMLGKGHSSEVFIKNAKENKFEFISPEFFLIELGKHTDEIAKRSKYSSEEIISAINFISKQIRFIQEKEYKDKLIEAREILRVHEKDVPYLALALAFNCKIFSGDKVLKSIIPDRVESPTEVLDRFNE